MNTIIGFVDWLVWGALFFAAGWLTHTYVTQHYLCILGTCFVK